MADGDEADVVRSITACTVKIEYLSDLAQELKDEQGKVDDHISELKEMVKGVQSSIPQLRVDSKTTLDRYQSDFDRKIEDIQGELEGLRDQLEILKETVEDEKSAIDKFMGTVRANILKHLSNFLAIVLLSALGIGLVYLLFFRNTKDILDPLTDQLEDQLEADVEAPKEKDAK